MSLSKLFEEENFNIYIERFNNLINDKNVIFEPLEKYKTHTFKIFMNVFNNQHWQYFLLINSGINIPREKYITHKVRYNLICILKLVKYFISNYLIDYIIHMNTFEYRDKYIDYYIYNQRNVYMNPVNKSIYDKKLNNTITDYYIFRRNKVILINSSSGKIARWYRKHSQNRKTKLIISSYRTLNNLKYSLPTDIIRNILKL